MHSSANHNSFYILANFQLQTSVHADQLADSNVCLTANEMSTSSARMVPSSQPEVKELSFSQWDDKIMCQPANQRLEISFVLKWAIVIAHNETITIVVLVEK